MADGFSAIVDSTKLLALMDRVGPSLEFHTRDVARETAGRVVAEAERRVERATGKTAEGIHAEMTKDGKGYLVMGYTAGAQPSPVDIYLEFGTEYSYKRPFLFSSALLENGPHLRRMQERVQQVLDDLGR